MGYCYAIARCRRTHIPSHAPVATQKSYLQRSSLGLTTVRYTVVTLDYMPCVFTTGGCVTWLLAALGMRGLSLPYRMNTTLDGNTGTSQAQAQVSALQYRALHFMHPESSSSLQRLPHVGQNVRLGSYCFAIAMIDTPLKGIGGNGRIRTCDTR